MPPFGRQVNLPRGGTVFPSQRGTVAPVARSIKEGVERFGVGFRPPPSVFQPGCQTGSNTKNELGGRVNVLK